MRILLIDDDAGVRRAYARMLQMLEREHRVAIEIVTVATCELGMEQLRAAPFDLIVTDNDTGTPLLGIDLIRQVRTLGIPTAIILIATEGPRLTLQQGHEAARNNSWVVWLPKPVNSEVLRDTAWRYIAAITPAP